jgi:hypothetical protein
MNEGREHATDQDVTVIVAMVSQRPGCVNEKGKQIVTQGKKLAVVSTSRKGARGLFRGVEKAKIGRPSSAPDSSLKERVGFPQFGAEINAANSEVWPPRCGKGTVNFEF